MQNTVLVTISPETIFSQPDNPKISLCDRRFTLKNEYSCRLAEGIEIAVGNNRFRVVTKEHRDIPQAKQYQIKLNMGTVIIMDGIPLALADDLMVKLPADCKVIIHEDNYLIQDGSSSMMKLTRPLEAKILHPFLSHPIWIPTEPTEPRVKQEFQTRDFIDDDLLTPKSRRKIPNCDGSITRNYLSSYEAVQRRDKRLGLI